MPDGTAEERWAPIPRNPGYEASDLGRVRSVDRITVGKCGRRFRFRGRVLTGVPSDRGYLFVCMGRGYRTRPVHQLVLEAFVGPRPSEDMDACHNNGVPDDNRLENLRWDSKIANSSDILRHGNNHGATKRTCKRGHSLFPPNLQAGNLKQRGGRACLACGRARGRAAYWKRHGRVMDIQAEADLEFSVIMQSFPAAS